MRLIHLSVISCARCGGTPPEALMKTLTDRKIAQEQVITYEGQTKAQETRRTLMKETAIADMQSDVVTAEQGVLISERIADAVVKKQRGDSEAVKIAAEANAKATELAAKAESTRIALTGSAESGKILAIGKANAESYRLAVESMGKENFTSYKMTEELGKSKMKLIPDVLINGGSGSGAVEGMLGMKLMDMIGNRIDSNIPVVVTPTNQKGKDK